jgi:RluA family pseudouridine synthase
MDQNLLTHTVPDTVGKIRLSDYLIGLFPDTATGNSAKKAIKRGMVTIDGEPGQTGRWVEPGMRIDYRPVLHPRLRIYDREIEIVYQDEHLAVLWKPSGLLTSGNAHQTLHNTLLHNLQPTDQYPPRPVHRLDRATSGLVIIGKTTRCTMLLTEMLERRKVLKTYHAVVTGKVPEKEVITQPIDGKEAETELFCIGRSQTGYFSLIRLHPKTGRTHQLRIHCAEQGYPIVGDQLYGKHDQGKGLYLSATGLLFSHPITGEEMNIARTIPRKLEKMMKK